jgi:primary-amine oxidase
MRRFQSGGSFSSEPRPRSRASSFNSSVPKGLLFCSAGLLALLASSILPARAQTAPHPLDGLTAPEYWTSYEVLKASGKVNSKTRYTLVQLQEPPKEEVLAWKPGQPIRRQSRVVVKQGPQTFEAIVDLGAKKLGSWNEVKGIQPNMPFEEEMDSGVDEAVKANTEWQAAMRRRGYTDFDTVHCGGYGTGYFATPEEQGRRLLRVECQDSRGVWEGWGRPLEGLVVMWDANERKVLRVIDSGVVPVPQAPANFDLASVGALRAMPTPITVQQPLGQSFLLEGQSVNWQKWNFHFRIDRRVGLVVTNVGYEDGGKLRSILYEGSLSEMFVPYMDPSEGWYAKSFFDAGEFADGFSSSLEPGEDCPENAVYFEQVYANFKGIPQLRPRAACLFEQAAGDIAWRHEGSMVESRKGRSLVLRSIGVFGNYDYVFDWIFRQDGTIQVRVGATGLDEVKGVKGRTADDDHDGKSDMYGRFIAENIVGVNHDHYFSYRLDFDVDGAANSFVRDRLSVKRLPSSSPRKSLWVAEPLTAKTEQQAKLHMSMEQPEIWRVVNPNVKSPLGYPVGYELMPTEGAMSLMVPEDYPQQRAGFIDYQLWVTPYRDNERYAAGDYPMQSKGGDGLPSWTKADRGIENTDIVLWYTLGFHHVPHAEDWPVMPAMWHVFELRPVNFFAHNPALDLPK